MWAVVDTAMPEKTAVQYTILRGPSPAWSLSFRSARRVLVETMELIHGCELEPECPKGVESATSFWGDITEDLEPCDRRDGKQLGQGGADVREIGNDKSIWLHRADPSWPHPRPV